VATSKVPFFLRAVPLGPFSVGHSPSSVAAGGFNGDSYMDLPTTNELDNTVTILPVSYTHLDVYKRQGLPSLYSLCSAAKVFSDVASALWI